MSEEPTITPETQPITETAQVPEPTKAEIRKHKIKVDGKEEELDESEILRLASLGKGSQKRFSEAAAQRKETEEFVHLLKTNPRAILSDPRIGVDVKKFAEEILWEHLQDQSLTPEQKNQRKIEAELKRYKDQEESTKKESDQKQAEIEQKQHEAAYEKKIMTALDSGNLPKNQFTVKRMAE